MRDSWSIFKANRDAGVPKNGSFMENPTAIGRSSCSALMPCIGFAAMTKRTHMYSIQAHRGNPLALKALRFLRLHSPFEYAAIESQSSTQKV